MQNGFFKLKIKKKKKKKNLLRKQVNIKIDCVNSFEMCIVANRGIRIGENTFRRLK